MRTNSNNRLVLLLVLSGLLGLLALAGCGSDDDGTPATNGSQGDDRVVEGSGGDDSGADNRNGTEDGGDGGNGSKSQFIEEADAICERARLQTAARANEFLGQEVNSPADEEQITREITTKVVIPGIEKRIRGIRALDVPPSAEKSARAVLAGFEEVLEAAVSNPAGLEAQTTLAKLERLRATAARHGFTACNRYLG